ncbi:MAG: ExsB family transcriptional regulator, partial [Candidatus Aminicenantes bacterium]|nr:ExsB family transcriptional regulator [Candidatus Aminicenantes bacterium]
FQYMAILHENKVTGVKNGKRFPGYQIEIRCWDSKDAITGTPFRLPHGLLVMLGEKITSNVPGVVSVLYNITKKPPLTIEAV